MNVPGLPHASVPVVEKSGHMTSDWYRFFTQFMKEAQTSLSEEGLFVPQQPTANIAVLQASTPPPSIIYNNQTHQPLISVNGVYKQIVTS